MNKKCKHCKAGATRVDEVTRHDTGLSEGAEISAVKCKVFHIVVLFLTRAYVLVMMSSLGLIMW